ncbi:MAG: hypothetical protein GF309_00155 [Candidatus Lokiarchaeota archaeon]|nr:hypothetical protein [Candidatus Lokiarchaeota archaeon]
MQASRWFKHFRNKAFRKLNSVGLFVEKAPETRLIVAGYTRSGTTFLANLLSNAAGARMIHEPLNTMRVLFFKELRNRDSKTHLIGNARARKELMAAFSDSFRGNRYTNRGTRLFYRSRIVKLVRANFYLDLIAELLPATKICFIVRHPCACIYSRLRLGWDAPDMSNCIEDIYPELNRVQKELYDSPQSGARAVAVTWCLDNLVALKNIKHDQFQFVYFEELLDSSLQMAQRLLKFAAFDGIRRSAISEAFLQLSYERERETRNSNGNWKDNLEPSEIEGILDVVRTFGLGQLYDLQTHEPGKMVGSL